MKIGILGAGQLARMLALSGYPLGFQFSCFSPDTGACGTDVMPHVQGNWNDKAALKRFTQDLDIVTFETENIPQETAEILESLGKNLLPNALALKISQDRLLEKDFVRSLGIPTAKYQAIASLSDLEKACQGSKDLQILKTRRNGYDGKGQSRIAPGSQVNEAWQKIQGAESILEDCVYFDFETSLVAVRNIKGDCRFYPLVHNIHEGGILTESCPLDESNRKIFQAKAENYSRLIMEKLNFVGVLTIEFFAKGEELIVNEMSPRVHNSGHWTLDASPTSQFENHIRAISGLSLGDTSMREEFHMFNILGRMPQVAELSDINDLRIHNYRKADVPGRKMGHLTLLKPSPDRIRLVKEFLAVKTKFS